MCLKIYELDSSLFDIAPGLVWTSKKTKVKLDLLTEINVINNRKRYHEKLKTEVEYVILVINIWKLITKDCDENKEPVYLKDWDLNNFHGWAMSLILPLSSFKWVEVTCQFN